MKLYIDDDNYVTGYTLSCLNYDNIDGIEYTGDIPSDFNSSCICYKFINGCLVLDENKLLKTNQIKLLANLRSQREKDCFPIINRGALWYGRLSVEQKAELDAWYQAWLNVTETKVVPETPEWLK